MDAKVLETVTLCIPFYRNSAMLKHQLEEWINYPWQIRVIVVDDGSPEPASDIVDEYFGELPFDLQLYRILVDIPWNRNGARNLAAHVAETEWLLMSDIDHVLPAEAAVQLLEQTVDPQHWYRFHRWRVGAADETRKKDEIAEACAFGEIKPHIDSYLATREAYWAIGGTDEDYSGVLGGGSPFLRLMEKHLGEPVLMPPDIPLHVYTRYAVPDANDWSLSRDTKPGKDITKRKRTNGDVRPKNPLRFPWERVL
jgi:glycosyltransferase involved in cell wall biosynthesis